MRVDIDSPLSSVSAFAMDLKRIQTPHRLFWGSLTEKKPLLPVGQAAEFKFESKIKPQPVIWQTLTKAFPEENQRF